jgi:hypothetical protein
LDPWLFLPKDAKEKEREKWQNTQVEEEDKDTLISYCHPLSKGKKEGDNC